MTYMVEIQRGKWFVFNIYDYKLITVFLVILIYLNTYVCLCILPGHVDNYGSNCNNLKY